MEKWVEVLMGSCVRVEGGTGFLVERETGVRIILTAEHVVRGKNAVSVRWEGGIAALGVVSAHPDLDVAIVADHPKLDERPALTLSGVDPAAGDSVAFAGYPNGWNELMPVLQRGWVAAASGTEELWLDGSANPGNSGGPIIVLGSSGPSVVGVLLGRAGNVDKALADFAANANQLFEDAKHFQGALIQGTEDDPVDVVGSVLRLSTVGLRDLARLMERHFRTGLVRAAALSRIRRALG